MGHEFIHVANFINIPLANFQFNENMSEYAAHMWEYREAVFYKYPWPEQYRNNALHYYNPKSFWNIFDGSEVYNYMFYEKYGLPDHF